VIHAVCCSALGRARNLPGPFSMLLVEQLGLSQSVAPYCSLVACR
jgi:hypothetical protein